MVEEVDKINKAYKEALEYKRNQMIKSIKLCLILCLFPVVFWVSNSGINWIRSY